MSEIKVNSIKGVGASAAAITVNNTDGTCTANVTNRPNENLIINGAMEIQQRTAGNYTTVTGGYTGIDRYHVYANPASKLTYEPSTDSPVGFSSSFKITSTSAYTPVSGNYHYVGQRIEGYNWQHLEYGTSNAKTITISFFVKSSITGTWSGIVKNNAQNRTFAWEYTISSANTWEKKTITVPGCPDGTWLTSNAAGAWIYFCMGSSASGTNYLGSANSWQSTNLIGSTGSNSLPNTNGATWYMTGLKVEEGSVATDFEHRSFGQELDLCMRYFQRFVSDNNYQIGMGAYYTANQLKCIVPFIKEMRAAPSVIQVTGTDYYVFYRNGAADYFDSFGVENTDERKTCLNNSTQMSGTVGQGGIVRTYNASSRLDLNAEL